MTQTRRVLAGVCLAALWAISSGQANEPVQPARGALEDAFLQNLIGSWKVARRRAPAGAGAVARAQPDRRRSAPSSC
jgi:hypothetical protein